MKRGFQGKLREFTDPISEQYFAGNTTLDYTTTSSMIQIESVSSGGVSSTATTNTQNRTSNEAVDALSAK